MQCSGYDLLDWTDKSRVAGVIVEYPASTAVANGATQQVGTITDAELEALALAADPDLPLDPDAVPMDEWLTQSVDLLPSWYMAPAMTRRMRKAPLVLLLIVIATFVAIEAVGLCSTYGQPPFH
jgi:hypothetical protein